MNVRSIGLLYGGTNAHQCSNFVPVPPGSIGNARGPFYDESGIPYFAVWFGPILVRCARSRFEPIPPQ